jgi:DNA repair protein RadD
MLREYQQRSIDQLYEWFRANPSGHPCLVLPTGSGKSHIVAALCKDALQTWPSTRILMLTNQKELIEQNAEKMRQHWPNAPLGIYSAGIGRRELGEPITFAGIQSVHAKAKAIGHCDLVIVDEAHTINHRAEGGYRNLIQGLQEINPALRVVGLTGTPYRLGHGLITDKPALFDALIEPVTISELVQGGYLCMLRSKVTQERLDATTLHKRGGEYIESEMQAAFDTQTHNTHIVDEVIRLAGNRKSWLFFCAGVKHAENIRDELTARGIVAACVTGKTPKKERAQILAAYKRGEIRALTNANVLTTGFDHPGIDLIAMLRATLSAGLYMQMAGRGLRVAPGKPDCLVLDFAGVVATHGPITAVEPPRRAGNGKGDESPPVKECPQCGELVAPAVRACTACGYEFPPPEEKPLHLRADDIMGMENQTMAVTGWQWREHTSRTSGKTMLKITYYGSLSDPPVTEYLSILHDGYAGRKAMHQLSQIAAKVGVEFSPGDTLPQLVAVMNQGTAPHEITYRQDGKFYRVIARTFLGDQAEPGESGFFAQAAARG